MLYVVATPIGDSNEISLRALEVLKTCELIICEGTKETSKLLRTHGITGKKYEILDEHSKPEDLKLLLDLCLQQDAALVTDCGTPGFCDPGADLVRACRQKNIPVRSVLGASALMGLLSLSGQRLDQFVFRGFLPAENEARKEALLALTQERRAIVLMDTPYRLQKTLQDMKDHFSDRRFLLVLNLSQPDETLLEGKIESLLAGLQVEKAEFMLLLYPETSAAAPLPKAPAGIKSVPAKPSYAKNSSRPPRYDPQFEPVPSSGSGPRSKDNARTRSKPKFKLGRSNKNK